MGMGMSFVGIIVFLLSGGDVLKHPPRDLVSLVDTQRALQILNVEDSENALLAVLQTEPKVPAIPGAAELEKAARDMASADAATRQQAAAILRAAGADALPYLDKVTSNNADVTQLVEETRMLIEMKRQVATAQEERNDELAKQVFAIRRLEQMKSKAALPTLEKLKAGADPTLAEMAREAIEQIEGRPLARPAAHQLLQQLGGRIGMPVGGVAMADLVTDAQDRSLRQMMDALPLPNQMKMPASILDQLDQNVVTFIGNVGNMRIDAICMMSPPDLGADRASEYFVWTMKGFWDKARLEAAWKKQSARTTVIYDANGVTAVDNQDATLCVLDNNSLIFSIRSTQRTQVPFEALITNLTGEVFGRPAIPQVIKTTELIGSGNRLAVAVAFSERQVGEINDELGREITRRNDNARSENYWVPDFCQMTLEAVRAKMLTGTLDIDGQIVLVAEQPPEPEKLAGYADAFQKHFIEFMSAQMAGAPQEVRDMFSLQPDLLSIQAEEDRVVVSLPADALKGVMRMIFRGRTAAVRRTAPSVQAAPPRPMLVAPVRPSPSPVAVE